MRRLSTIISCTLATLALGACASAPDRTSSRLDSSSAAAPAKATFMGAGGAAAGGGGQAATNVNTRNPK